MPRLIRTIWRFPQLVRPAILRDFERWRDTKTLIHIRSDAGLQRFLSSVARAAAG